jgi:hypothetical protein
MRKNEGVSGVETQNHMSILNKKFEKHGYSRDAPLLVTLLEN